MPPAVSDDDASSVADIPPRKKGTGKDKAVKEEAVKEEEDDEEGEDLEADEYVVEKIKSHRFEPDGTIKYEVKWQGFDDKENTWEPEENLTGCIQDLTDYYAKIGGKPKIPEAKNKGTPKTSAKKRKLSEGAPAKSETPETTTKSARGRKKTKVDEDTPKKEWKPPSGSWEDHVISVDTMEKDPENDTISAYLMWSDGHRSMHSAKIVHQKCPQKMLQFYEAHLQFNTAPPKAEPQPSNGTKKEEEVKEDYHDDEMAEEDGIKGVASTMADGFKKVVTSMKESFGA